MHRRWLCGLCALLASFGVEGSDAEAEGRDLAVAGRASSATRDVLYSSLRNERTCERGHCVVPAGEVWILDANMTVETLTVRGTLKWDTEIDGLVLTTGYLLVADQGYFQVGTRVKPMDKRATVYIAKNSHTHDDLGYRFLASLGEARVDIHGRPLGRTWTLLSRTAQAGSSQLFLKHHPLDMGWRVGDRIGVATTSRGNSTQHTITGIGPSTQWKLSVASAVAGAENPSWGMGAAMAVDGNVRTRWGSFCVPHCTGKDQWLALNLETQSKVSSIRLKWHWDRFAPQYSLQVWRPNGTDWETAAVVDGRGGWREVPVNREAVALRIFANWTAMKEQRSDYWAGLWLYEVEVYGVDSSTDTSQVVHVTPPLTADHWGGFREIAGYRLEMAAEVVNLERSVLITGDHSDFEETQQGIHTAMMGKGAMDVRYTRVEYCGQRDFMGRYCLHLHLGGQCPECSFAGNAIVESQQVGITVHGTHRSLVDNNVLWDTRGAGIYIEDGNEMYNTISNNVIICSHHRKCSVSFLGRSGQIAGIYLIGMTNHLIGNRIAGWENGIWSPGGFNGNGQGRAVNRVCPASTPFGTIRGNVNHDNNRFGLYLDNQHPRNLERDSDGFVTNMGSCGRFTPDGRDNGLSPANEVEDEFDWHNQFVGQYAMSDIAYVRYISVNNAHALYWKTSKNFADGKSVHVRDSIFLNDPSDPYGSLQVLGPAGGFAFIMRNCTFAGGPVSNAVLAAGQACGFGGAGGPCNVQYLLDGVDFRVSDSAKRIKFGVHSDSPGYLQPMFIARDGSLGGHRNIVSRYLTGFADVPGCVQTGVQWDYGYSCNASVRRLNIWSRNVGPLKLSGPGYNVAPIMDAPTFGMNSGIIPYEPMHKGYGGVVLAGMSYSINGSWQGETAIEFSDLVLERFFGEPEGVYLNISGKPCLLSSSSDRSFILPNGVAPGIILKTVCTIPPTPARPETTSTTTEAIGTSPPQAICQIGEEVPCCPDSSCSGRCTPGQCCPGVNGKTHTCPSAAASNTSQCSHGKAFDCTNLTGVGPPGRLQGQCEFQEPPAHPVYWEPRCEAGLIGCLADGINWECRFCGVPDWNVPCPPSTTTRPGLATTRTSTTSRTTTAAPSTTTSATPTSRPTICTGLLPDVVRNCSASGCKVLARGMTGRTCGEYCAASGFACAGAWEDMEDDCNVKATLTCDETFAGTPDLICECTGPTAPPTTTTTTTTMNFAWVYHAGFHCFDGNGAANIPGKSPLPGPLTLGACFAACKEEPLCHGVSVLRGRSPGACWQRTNLSLPNCMEGTEYDFWERVAQAPATTAPAASTTTASSPAGATSTTLAGTADTTTMAAATTSPTQPLTTSTTSPAAKTTTTQTSTGAPTTIATTSTTTLATTTVAAATTTVAATTVAITTRATTTASAVATTTFRATTIATTSTRPSTTTAITTTTFGGTTTKSTTFASSTTLPATTASSTAVTTASTTRAARMTTTTRAPPSGGLVHGHIRNIHGLCIEVVGEWEKRAAVRMKQCGEDCAEWTWDPRTGLIKLGDGSLRLCLDSPAGTTPHGRVHLWTCNSGNANQQWRYDEGRRQIRSRHGLCLDSPARTSNGGSIFMWRCNAHSPNQQWRIGGPLTTTTTTPSLIWVYHPGRHCHPGHGAEPVDGKERLAGLYTLEGCKAECEAEPECEGITVPHSEEGSLKGSCGLRRAVHVIQCEPMTRWDFWQRAQDTARWTTATTTMVTEQSTSHNMTVWTPHPGVHCWPGAGAELLENRQAPLRHVTLEECQHECDEEDLCEAITVKREEGSDILAHCWLQRRVRLDHCREEEDPAYNVYERMRVRQPDNSTTATTTGTPTSHWRGVWVRHAHRNCWPGHGAKVLPGRPTLPGYKLSQCKARCEAEPTCQAIAVRHEEGDEELPGNCRLRRDLEVSECVRDMAFDLWERVPVGRRRISWVRHHGLMCGNGKGAEGLPGKSTLPGRYTLDDCKVQCQAEPKCEGVLFLHGAEMAKCRLRMDLDVEGCDTNGRYDLWERVVEPVPGEEHPGQALNARRRRRRRALLSELVALPS